MNSISFELNLKEKTWSQYLDEDILLASGNYMESGRTEDEALQEMIKDMNFMGFNEMVFLDEDKVRLATGLEMDDEGNLYDPLAKDMDNDGIPDRYNHDFRDSYCLASTFDIDVNEKYEKPSIMGWRS